MCMDAISFRSAMILLIAMSFCYQASARDVCLSSETYASPRTMLPLDSGWRFLRTEAPLAEQSAFDDSSWQKVTLPHTYNGADGDDGGGYYRGPAWYRRTLMLGALAGKRAFLQFDGAALATDVYVNGTLVGRHEGGYAGFRFDVTEHLKPGVNQLSIRVDNSKAAAIAPLGGDFTVFGGLFRHVYLVVTADLHIDLSDQGGPGVYVTTSSLKPDTAATLSVVSRIRNDRTKSARITVSTLVYKQSGEEVARTEKSLNVPARTTARLEQKTTLDKPRLWDGVRDPYLYRIVTEVHENHRAKGRSLRDSLSIAHGVRTVQIDPNRGFILNGKPISVHGVNLFHSGRPGRGLAVTDKEISDDMATLKELGVTGVRFVHFQHPPRAYEEADCLGFIVWTEVPLNGAIDAGAAFEANIAQQMRELIRQNYNHPAVAVWGLGNEVYATTPDVNHVLETVQRVARQEDASRPTAYAHCCQADDNAKALFSDVGAFNRYFGWYGEQKGTLGEWARNFHEKFPARPFAVSEYGAGASIRHQEDPPRRPDPPGGWHPEQYQALFHEKSWREIAPLPYVWGKFVWVAFDLASDGRSEGDRPGINDKGLITYDRAIKKDAFYWYQANWSEKPVLHLTSARAELRTRPQVEVKVYTNTERVALEINDQRVGMAEVVDHVASWPAVSLREGSNKIEVEAEWKGAVLQDTAEWVYVPPPEGLQSVLP